MTCQTYHWQSLVTVLHSMQCLDNVKMHKYDSVKMDISRTLSDLYIQEWNEKVNVSSKGKQYLFF